MEDIMTSQTEEKEAEAVTANEPVDLIEIVRAKHEESSTRAENISDVLVMQIILCILLLLIMAAANMIFPEFTADFISRFRKITSGDTEDFFKNAVNKVIKIINA